MNADETAVVTQPAHQYCTFETAGGVCAIAWNDAGITRFQLPASGAAAAERAVFRRLPNAVRSRPAVDVAGVIGAAVRYFGGERIDFSDVAVDLDGQDDFFRRVYQAVREIGWGQTTTYGTVAKALG